ncbi:MAG: phosphatidyl-myo-inositol alpha-mannosyltransferase [Actinomycetota bacterium]|jgi:glycosyltransferase involved in cell wall biosynthesis
MHIAIVTNYLPPRAGGLEGVVDALARGYTDAGDEVIVTGYDDGAAAAPYRREALHGWNGLERRGIPVPLLTPRSLVRLWRVVRGADAVHIHGLVFVSSVVALLASRSEQRVVVTEHVGLVPYRSRIAGWLQFCALFVGARLAVRRDAMIATLNDRVAADVGRVAPRATIRKIPNAVDLGLFSPSTAARRLESRGALGWTGPVVLVVARNAPKKRLDLVLGAARRLRSVRFVVCGLDTDELPWAEPNVEVLGAVERSRLVDLYRAADLLLLPSEGEGQPLAVLEALACGLPVVLGADPDVMAELPDCVVPVERTVDAVVDAITETVAEADGRSLADTCTRSVADRGWPGAVATYRSLLDRPDPSAAKATT